MESLRLRLRHLEDIQGLAQQGDVTLARELLRTLQCSSGGDDHVNGVGGIAATMTTARSGGLTPGRFRGTPGGLVVNGEDSNTMMDYWPRLPATTASPHRAVRGSTRRPVRLAPIEEGTYPSPSSRLGGGSGGGMADDGASPSPQHNGRVALPMSSERSLRSRMREVEHRKESFPDRHIFRLRTVHHIFPETYPLIGDLDEAIATVEHELREMHRAIQRKSVQFERLEPGENYFVRERKTIAETIALEEGRLATERQVLRDRLAAAVCERDVVQQRVAELQDKVTLLKQHVQSVHDALERERQLLRETYPSLTSSELFGTTSATELSRIIAEKRRSVKETRQYLYKLRTNHEHSIKASVRQVQKKATELHDLQNDALLFGNVRTPQSTSRPVVDGTPECVVDSNARGSSEFVAFAEGNSCEDGAPPSREPVLPAVTPPTTPTPAAVDSGRKVATRRTPDAPVSSLQVLSSLHKRSNGTTTSSSPASSPAPATTSGAGRQTRILANALPALKNTCLASETEQRHQVECIFLQSWQLLHHVEMSERLVLQETELQRLTTTTHVTPHRAVRLNRPAAPAVKATSGGLAQPQRSTARAPAAAAAGRQESALPPTERRSDESTVTPGVSTQTRAPLAAVAVVERRSIASNAPENGGPPPREKESEVGRGQVVHADSPEQTTVARKVLTSDQETLRPGGVSATMKVTDCEKEADGCDQRVDASDEADREAVPVGEDDAAASRPPVAAIVVGHSPKSRVSESHNDGEVTSIPAVRKGDDGDAAHPAEDGADQEAKSDSESDVAEQSSTLTPPDEVAVAQQRDGDQNSANPSAPDGKAGDSDDENVENDTGSAPPSDDDDGSEPRVEGSSPVVCAEETATKVEADPDEEKGGSGASDPSVADDGERSHCSSGDKESASEAQADGEEEDEHEAPQSATSAAGNATLQHGSFELTTTAAAAETSVAQAHEHASDEDYRSDTPNDDDDDDGSPPSGSRASSPDEDPDEDEDDEEDQHPAA